MKDAKKSILVMDDSSIVLDTLRAVLEASGYGVTTVASLSELESARASIHPDLFILDVQMPEAFGDDVARVLREVKSVQAPILLFSSLNEDALAARAKDAELAGYVSKNAGLDALLERVSTLLAR
jgi:two-component system torCAD operon response regulator TorR